MNEYESCKTDIGVINAAKEANDVIDSLNLREVLVEWLDVILVYVSSYACEKHLESNWEEEHPLHIIMLDKVAELMGLELRENSIVEVNNAYDWLASVVGENQGE